MKLFRRLYNRLPWIRRRNAKRQINWQQPELRKTIAMPNRRGERGVLSVRRLDKAA